jgi:hypothetical protein
VIMKLKNNELEKKEVLINRVRLETQLEELLENLLEEMNKQLIVYMPLMILCMLKLNELKEMLKEMALFFVFQIQEEVLRIEAATNCLKYRWLRYSGSKFQFSVSASGFSVLLQVISLSILCIAPHFLCK